VTMMHQAQPVLMKRDASRVDAELPELVEIAMSCVPPIVKLDAKLESRLRRADKFRFTNTKDLVEDLKRRDRRFPHTDSSEFLGFDERDPMRLFQGMGQACGGHPSGRAATDDHVMHIVNTEDLTVYG